MDAPKKAYVECGKDAPKKAYVECGKDAPKKAYVEAVVWLHLRKHT
jgi:hypothetical protein